MKFPTLAQWKRFLQILSRIEKIAFFSFIAIAVASAATLAISLYQNHTVQVPADNGTFVEGSLDQPRFLNPLYSDSRSIDQDVSQLLFSSLLDYGQNGQIVDGLATYTVTDDGKTYDFILKDGLKWSDGSAITADDVIFTIKIIQDKNYNSPLRPKWIAVETEKISDTAFRLILKEPYANFPETCVLKIVPKHVWETIAAENFTLSPYNLDPVVSGPYKVKQKNLAKDGSISSLDLERNLQYSGKKPHLARVTFMFFPDETGLVAAMKRGQIQGFLASDDVFRAGVAGTNSYSFAMPGYFAIFFDAENNKALEETKVRTALAYATDKKEILDSALLGKGKIIDSPIDGDIYGIRAASTTYGFDPQKAAQLLEDAGYKLGGDGVRVKTVNRQHAFTFTKNLLKGTNLTADVMELQKCLVREVMPGLDTNGNYGDKTVEAVKLFQEKYRADILDSQGIKEPNGETKQATREKLNQVCFPSGDSVTPLSITLTVANQSPFTSVGEIIKAQWAKIGVAVTMNPVDVTALERDVVKPRTYQALLFGQAFGMIPDPYAFWHSTQKVDPGLNLSLYENKDADKLMEEIRQATNKGIFNDKLAAFQDIVAQDEPAIFLYNPDYIYIASTQVSGIKPGLIADTARRFANIADWYTITKRTWK